VSHEIRIAADEDWADWIGTLLTAFGETINEEHVEDDRATWADLDRTLGVVEDGRWVGTAAAYTFDLTLPGGTTAPAAGVTAVGVLPTHRRQGVLTALMDRQLDDVAERGEPLAILGASEAVIYGRFGYGVATHFAKAEIDSRRADFVTPPSVSGRIRLVSKDEAAKILPGLWDQYRVTRPGELTRDAHYWDVHFRDRERWRRGASTNHFAIHESTAGVADGYARYRIKDDWSPAHPGNTVFGLEVISADQEVEAALWRFLIDIDLTLSVKEMYRPVDDWLRWRLVDSRAYRTAEIADFLWVRPVDIAAALAARRYGQEGTLVLGVTDPFRPANTGAYRLDGGPDGATCTRVDTAVEPDIALEARALGSLYLGGVSFTTLARAGRVHASDQATLRKADVMFAGQVAPFNQTGF
jgi:predicted acetyltransferase